jgi:hypothetical protein
VVRDGDGPKGCETPRGAVCATVGRVAQGNLTRAATCYIFDRRGRVA